MIVTSISKSFEKRLIIDSLSLEIEEHKIHAILGPSGCGKTTLLRILSGLSQADAGSIESIPLKKSFIFQEPRLLPSLSCLQNIELVIAEKLNKKEARERALSFLNTVGLSDFAHLLPHELSGGMRQRVSIARAFAYTSPILFMDEPFQALDLKTRYDLMNSFLKLWKEEARTTVFVSHDIQEALYLGDTITVLSSLPAKVQKTFILPWGHDCRVFGETKFEALEKELYELVLGSSCQD